MKKHFYVLKELLHFLFVAIPVFCAVITMVYVGFFFYDTYKLIKNIYEKAFQINRRGSVSERNTTS